MLVRPRWARLSFQVCLVAAPLSSIALVGLLVFDNPKRTVSKQVVRTIQLLAAAANEVRSYRSRFATEGTAKC